ncbi:Pro-Pol polyprotein [Golovinomyces cichoracearum]|uniref:Pro-Pol polyprotein n=1 Tax=Golovinomyces cichoracearum TaxID=62708 RepID=A0A420J3K8_9PEZI|nr:Pro-Pol polyprotein [Golovinomyces cichoracearum]
MGSSVVLLEQVDKSTMKYSMTASLRVQEEQNMQVVLMANLCERNLARDGNLNERYSNSSWYDDISEYLLHRRFSKDCKTKVQQAALIRKINHFSVAENGDLYYELRGIRKRCLTEQEVASVLMEVHDNGGHFSQAITLRKLKYYHWPRMANDLRDYILGCLVCAKYGTAIRSQLLTWVTVSEPMELLGIDFAGPFPKSTGTNEKWILVAIDYFSRYVWAEATQKNDSDTVIKFLKTSIFDRFGMPVGVYMDPGTHFGEKTRRFAEEQGVVWCNSPVAAKKAVVMVEKAIDILQRILKKTTDVRRWANNVPAATLEVNKREIPHLTYSPPNILFGFDPAGTLDVKFPLEKRKNLAASLARGKTDIYLNDDEHADKVIHYIIDHARKQSEVLERSYRAKDKSADRHD